MGNVDLPEEIETAVRDGRPGRRPAPHRVSPDRPRQRSRPKTSRPTTSAGSPPRSPATPSSSAPSISAATSSRSAFKAPAEANPFLGWRSIRVCLDEPEVFRPQIRAVLRAAAGRDIQLMLPLVTLVEEVEEAREIVAGGGASAPAGGRPRGGSRCRSG